MASPHVAGIAAYFLSLYPDGFNVETEEFVGVPKMTFVGSAQAFFGFGQSKVRTTGDDKPLSPRALKKAIQKVGTKNAITGVSSRRTAVFCYSWVVTDCKTMRACRRTCPLALPTFSSLTTTQVRLERSRGLGYGASEFGRATVAKTAARSWQRVLRLEPFL